MTEYVDFTGQTNAVQAVDIRPRVTGYLVEMPFQEGAEASRRGTLCSWWILVLTRLSSTGQGQVNLYKAQLKLAKVVYARDLAINARVPDSVSKEHLDQDRAAVEEADAGSRRSRKTWRPINSIMTLPRSSLRLTATSAATT